MALSIGATRFERPPDDLEALIGHGDVALYDVKRSGRNGTRILELTERRSPTSASNGLPGRPGFPGR
ncbi:MAG: hypothetical protein CMN25_14410 [Salinicola sp.]|uniref:hypothetical protein n=1 Tax=uncultured Salinicola sp. TaxID=1193542 RepID=UPI000C92E818|nr:hypothetical protein [uncultured Salinicola sp.]MAM58520.1 hypothetical protein [Salinicola sp.]